MLRSKNQNFFWRFPPTDVRHRSGRMPQMRQSKTSSISIHRKIKCFKFKSFSSLSASRAIYTWDFHRNAINIRCGWKKTRKSFVASLREKFLVLFSHLGKLTSRKRRKNVFGVVKIEKKKESAERVIKYAPGNCLYTHLNGGINWWFFFWRCIITSVFRPRASLSESINFVSGVAKVNSGCVCMAGLFFMAQQKENFFLFFFYYETISSSHTERADITSKTKSKQKNKFLGIGCWRCGRYSTGPATRISRFFFSNWRKGNLWTFSIFKEIYVHYVSANSHSTNCHFSDTQKSLDADERNHAARLVCI